MTLRHYSILIILMMGISTSISSQDTSDTMTKHDSLPYYSIPEPIAEYSAATVAARMIDGLGFRYRWATEGLTEDDLSYTPDSTARNSFETLEHVLGLSEMILTAVRQQPIIRSKDKKSYTWTEMRAMTLTNIKEASDILWQHPTADLNDYPIVFQRGDQSSEYPFWNLLNGPIADAMWHCGQIVSFRRASGNPIDPRVSVFSGTIRERE